MLELSALGMTIGAEEVLRDISLTVRPGEFVVLLGPSGCGKTTLLRLAAGLAEPSAGAVVNRFARYACVFQEPRLTPWADALDNAAFGLKAQGVRKDERRARAQKILTRLGVSPADQAKRPSALSGGMAQRVAFARALAVAPDLFLMDEPFSALDIGLRRDMQDLAAREVAKAGVGALFVTHEITEALRLATRIVVLSPRPARVVADFLHQPIDDVSRLYQGAAELLRRPEIENALFASVTRR
jgi:NitT/TauT family transport system ATP-binding protein